MEKCNRRCITDKLSKYDMLYNESDYIEITEWTNGEGFDVDINGKMLQLTYGQLNAINYLIKTLEYQK